MPAESSDDLKTGLNLLYLVVGELLREADQKTVDRVRSTLSQLKGASGNDVWPGMGDWADKILKS